MNHRLLSGVWLAAAVAALTPASASDIRSMVAHDEDACALLGENYIYLAAQGTADVDYQLARAMFEREDLLTAVQEEYARQLPVGEQPEFVVHRSGPGAYHYVNRKGQRSDVKELVRRHDRERGTELVLYASGRRFFGDFRALTRIRVDDAYGALSTYDVEVYAYPENRIIRFFARRLSAVERYFEEKTDHLIQLTTAICHGLVDEAGGLQAQVRLDPLDRPFDVLPVAEGAQAKEALATRAEAGARRAYDMTLAE